jgi:hypothetical protein
VQGLAVFLSKFSEAFSKSSKRKGQMLCQPLKRMPSRAAHLELGPIKRTKTNLEFSLHRAKKPNQLACRLGFSHSA